MSRYAVFRRRIAPVAFAAAIALIAYDTCDKQQRTHATVVLDFGDARPRVRAVEASLIVGDEPIVEFRRVALPGSPIGPCRFDVTVPDERAELHIDVDLDGSPREIVRRLHAVEGGMIEVKLERELR